MSKDLSKIFKQVDIKEHAKKKSMWGGSFEPSSHTEYIEEEGKFKQTSVVYADSLFKNFDEILVNVVDVWVKSKDKPKKYRTDECIIEFKDGYISIFNNGQGIPVDKVKDLKGNYVYIPHLISTEFLAGSNNEDDEERITGGVNGIGMSMVNNNSKHFILETVDLERKKYYKQECKDRLSIIGEPEVKNIKTLSNSNIHKKGGTTIKFLPDYSIYKCDVNDYSTLDKLFKSRALQIAAHTTINITYNGELLLKDSKKHPIELFASMLIENDAFVYIKLKHPKYDWDIVIGLTDGSSFESLSIINGVHVKSGNHINYIRDLIINGVKTKVEKLLKKFKEYKKSMVQNNLFVIISGNIPNPSFDSQTKTNISGSTTKYKDYSISNSIIGKFWKLLEPRLTEQFLSNNEKKNTKKQSTSGIKKYRKAKYAGTQKSKDCTLLICEGDSAESMTRTSLTSKQVHMGYDYYGTFNIGGVPMNSRTKSVICEPIDGKQIIRRQKQLIDNERLTSLAKVLNLDYSIDYSNQQQIRSLSYGQIVATVDQDLDGVGQIFGLLLSHIELFWPNLIKIGFVKQLATPIIRAFPKSGKSTVESFYTDLEYRNWVDEKFKGDESGLSKWEIKYYKGLATHNDEEAIHMFKKYDKSLYTITYDELASKTFNIYYGKDPDLRKTELVNKPIHPTINDMKISCTDQLKSHTKEFQLDNIKRKLPNVYDGLNPARRKILEGSRKRFLNNNTEVKVFQLAGFVAEKMNYHHGSASLEKTIVNMAQDFIGANNLPLLLPLSQFGSRFSGGKDYGAPRYIKTKLNKDLVSALFRYEDDYVLDYTYDEGMRNEPVHYVPVVPFVMLENLEIPATGWKYAGYARDWSSMYKNISMMIDKYEPDNPSCLHKLNVKTMGFWCNRWSGSIKSINTETGNQKWFMGSYKYSKEENTINITELPFQEWNENYIEKMESKQDVTTVEDNSSKTKVDITIKLKANFEIKKKITSEFDDVEEFCLLKKRMNKNLNVIKDDVVVECKKYKDILLIWFQKRYETYVKRFERLRIIIKLKILFLEQTTKFVKNHKKYNFSILDEKTAVELLSKDKYLQFNKSLLDNPELTPLDELEFKICDSSAPGTSYDYLFAIGPKQRMESARVSREKKLNDTKDYYDRIMSKDIITVTWKNELEELNNVIIKGTTDPKGWLYNERKVVFK